MLLFSHHFDTSLEWVLPNGVPSVNPYGVNEYSQEVSGSSVNFRTNDYSRIRMLCVDTLGDPLNPCYGEGQVAFASGFQSTVFNSSSLLELVEGADPDSVLWVPEVGRFQQGFKITTTQAFPVDYKGRPIVSFWFSVLNSYVQFPAWGIRCLTPGDVPEITCWNNTFYHLGNPAWCTDSQTYYGISAPGTWSYYTLGIDPAVFPESETEYLCLKKVTASFSFSGNQTILNEEVLAYSSDSVILRKEIILETYVYEGRLVVLQKFSDCTPSRTLFDVNVGFSWDTGWLGFRAGAYYDDFEGYSPNGLDKLELSTAQPGDELPPTPEVLYFNDFDTDFSRYQVSPYPIVPDPLPDFGGRVPIPFLGGDIEGFGPACQTEDCSWTGNLIYNGNWSQSGGKAVCGGAKDPHDILHCKALPEMQSGFSLTSNVGVCLAWGIVETDEPVSFEFICSGPEKLMGICVGTQGAGGGTMNYYQWYECQVGSYGATIREYRTYYNGTNYIPSVESTTLAYLYTGQAYASDTEVNVNVLESAIKVTLKHGSGSAITVGIYEHPTSWRTGWVGFNSATYFDDVDYFKVSTYVEECDGDYCRALYLHPSADLHKCFPNLTSYGWEQAYHGRTKVWLLDGSIHALFFQGAVGYSNLVYWYSTDGGFNWSKQYLPSLGDNANWSGISGTIGEEDVDTEAASVPTWFNVRLCKCPNGSDFVAVYRACHRGKSNAGISGGPTQDIRRMLTLYRYFTPGTGWSEPEVLDITSDTTIWDFSVTVKEDCSVFIDIFHNYMTLDFLAIDKEDYTAPGFTVRQNIQEERDGFDAYLDGLNICYGYYINQRELVEFQGTLYGVENTSFEGSYPGYSDFIVMYEIDENSKYNNPHIVLNLSNFQGDPSLSAVDEFYLMGTSVATNGNEITIVSMIEVYMEDYHDPSRNLIVFSRWDGDSWSEEVHVLPLLHDFDWVNGTAELNGDYVDIQGDYSYQPSAAFDGDGNLIILTDGSTAYEDIVPEINYSESIYSWYGCARILFRNPDGTLGEPSFWPPLILGHGINLSESWLASVAPNSASTGYLANSLVQEYAIIPESARYTTTSFFNFPGDSFSSVGGTWSSDGDGGVMSPPSGSPSYILYQEDASFFRLNPDLHVFQFILRGLGPGRMPVTPELEPDRYLIPGQGLIIFNTGLAPNGYPQDGYTITLSKPSLREHVLTLTKWKDGVAERERSNSVYIDSGLMPDENLIYPYCQTMAFEVNNETVQAYVAWAFKYGTNYPDSRTSYVMIADDEYRQGKDGFFTREPEFSFRNYYRYTIDERYWGEVMVISGTPSAQSED